MIKGKNIIPIETIQNKILLIRGKKVMLDRDLAELYGAKTKVLNQAVKRNPGRFPGDFLFSLDEKEKTELVTKCDRFKSLKHSSSLPFAFTENGVAMLSSVLNSEIAIQVNIQIMRTFTHIRELMANHEVVLSRLEQLEKKYSEHDQHIIRIFEVIKCIMDLPITLKPKRKPMGFIPPKKDVKV